MTLLLAALLCTAQAPAVDLLAETDRVAKELAQEVEELVSPYIHLTFEFMVETPQARQLGPDAIDGVEDLLFLVAPLLGPFFHLANTLLISWAWQISARV